MARDKFLDESHVPSGRRQQYRHFGQGPTHGQAASQERKRSAKAAKLAALNGPDAGEILAMRQSEVESICLRSMMEQDAAARAARRAAEDHRRLYGW